MKAASNIFGKRKHFSRNLFQKPHCVQGASTELFLLTKKDHWCPRHHFLFLLGINLSKLKAQVLVQCNAMKTFKNTYFQNKHNSGLCFKALKVVVKPICSTAEIFSKSWASLFSSTFAIVKGMEDRNTQQYLNILPPRTKNQIKLILNFSTKKKIKCCSYSPSEYHWQIFF